MAEVAIGSGTRRPLQLRRRRRDGWSDKKRQRFIDMLAGTCNVRMAADAAGVPTVAAYRLRRVDAAFDAAWREALAMGYERLETALLERALHEVGEVRPGSDETVARAADRAVGEMDSRLIAIVLAQYRGKIDGQAPRGRAPARRVATEEETNAELLRRLAVLGRQLRESGTDVPA